MNAVLSANTLPWRDSAAFNPDLHLGDVDPSDVYGFVGRNTFDRGFRERVLADPRGALADLGLPAEGAIWAPGLIDAKLDLADDELEILDQVTRKVHEGGLHGLLATERGALREGHGLPAVAAVIVILAVALVVVVVIAGLNPR